MTLPELLTARGRESDLTQFQVIAAVGMGAVEGLIFGMLDAEDDIYLQDQFLRTRRACVPLGGCTGALVGVLNQMFRYAETPDSYHKVSQVADAADEL